MARPRLALPPAEAVRALMDAQGHLWVKVTPGAHEDDVALPPAGSETRLIVRTTAAPDAGNANVAVIALVARTLGVPPSSIRLVGGARARIKRLKVSARP